MISLKWGFSIANLYSLPGLFSSWSYLENGLWFPMISCHDRPKRNPQNDSNRSHRTRRALAGGGLRGRRSVLKSPDVSMFLFFFTRTLEKFLWILHSYMILHHPTWISDTFCRSMTCLDMFIQVHPCFKAFQRGIQPSRTASWSPLWVRNPAPGRVTIGNYKTW